MTKREIGPSYESMVQKSSRQEDCYEGAGGMHGGGSGEHDNHSVMGWGVCEK